MSGRGWVHRFNGAGPDGLTDNLTGGLPPRWSMEQRAGLALIAGAGPDREKDGVMRWRRVDLQRVIPGQFGADYCERYVGFLLKQTGFSYISARPVDPGQDSGVMDVGVLDAFKKTLPAP